MKRTLHILVFATFLLLSLSGNGQDKGFQLPGKKPATTKTTPKKQTKSTSKQPAAAKQTHQPKSIQEERPVVTTYTIDGVTTYTINGVSFSMVYVEGGTFTMGATPEQGSDADSDEKPAHEVTLSSFSIGQHEVTQELWQAVMGNNPSFFKDSSQLPVEQVSWDDCQEFIRKLNALTGERFRLPTEAEWEYAARGGISSKGFRYPGSNFISDVGWFSDISLNHTFSIGNKKSNELGLYDMGGNVWEWCQDWYGKYSNKSQMNPLGSIIGHERVCRGGSWVSEYLNCRISCRDHRVPSFIAYNIGMRLALELYIMTIH